MTTVATGTSAPLPDDSSKSQQGGRIPPGARNVGDLFAPFFRVSFKNVTKQDIARVEESGGNATTLLAERLDPNTAFAQTGLNPVAEDDSTFTLDSKLLPKVAASLKVAAIGSAPLRFTLTLTPPYDDGIRILNSKLLNFGTLVSVQWGYTTWGGEDILSDVHVFQNQFPEVEFGQDITITAGGVDLTGAVGRRNSARRNWSYNEYSNDCEIVRKIVERTGTKLEISDDVPADSTFITGANRPPQESGGGTPAAGILQTTNDWAFIRRLCADHKLSCSAYTGVLRVYPPTAASPRANYVYRLLWRQAPQDGSDLPVYNVAGNILKHAFLPPASRGIVQFSWDPDKGVTTTKEASPAKSTDTVLGGAGSSDAATTINDDVFSMGGVGDGVEITLDNGELKISKPENDSNEDLGDVLSTPKETHNAEEKLNQIAEEAKAFAHPAVDITAPGVVDMWPNIIVLLEGTSQLFDGAYKVLNATHTISNNGYDMELRIIRQTVRGHDGEERPAGSVINLESRGGETETPVDEDASPIPDDVTGGTPPTLGG